MHLSLGRPARLAWINQCSNQNSCCAQRSDHTHVTLLQTLPHIYFHISLLRLEQSYMQGWNGHAHLQEQMILILKTTSVNHLLHDLLCEAAFTL